MLYEVEVYFGYYSGDGHFWDLDVIPVEAEDEDQAKERALKIFEASLIFNSHEVAFFGIYHCQISECENV